MTTTLDPTLDRNTADWFAPSCDRPRLSLLGPVDVRAQGGAPAAASSTTANCSRSSRCAAATGSTSTSSAWHWVGPTRLRKDISPLRTWLGADSWTGEPYLPTLGHHGYRAGDRLLVDLDLFGRLRLRGAPRGGAEGLSDRARALKLVSAAAAKVGHVQTTDPATTTADAPAITACWRPGTGAARRRVGMHRVDRGLPRDRCRSRSRRPRPARQRIPGSGPCGAASRAAQ